MEHWTYVGRLDEDFRQGPDGFSRLHCKVDGRYVSVLYKNKSRKSVDVDVRRRDVNATTPKAKAEEEKDIYCIDSICYHAGGPLSLGDIEEVRRRNDSEKV